ncbi:MAG TPA: DNA recombination protein RmuC [Candidatus Paceibacterota bacterium]|nr:DNA recombination protein RmuC [Candidatus Paceibacterota bacterium]
MEWLIIVLLAAVFGFQLFLFIRSQKPQNQGDTQSMILLQNQLAELTRSMDSKLGESTKTMSDFMSTQSEHGQRLLTNITKQVQDQLLEVVKGVTETKESTKQVLTVAEQLHNLEKVLKNQKQRGNLGEASLELILSNVLPGQYEPQYMFRDGEKVDFAVKTPEGIVPVDAKFPLENYVRLIDEVDPDKQEQYRREFKNDVKKRIDETAKYIRPEEGTLPFAFMFIPAEGIYYDLLNSDVGVGVNSRDLIDYAYSQKNVIITSPTTFLAYLKTILFGNQRMKIQEAAKDIIKNVGSLSKNLAAYQDAHNAMGKSLNTVVGHFEKSGKAFRAIDKDVIKITGDSMDIALETVDRPLLEGRE